MNRTGHAALVVVAVCSVLLLWFYAATHGFHAGFSAPGTPAAASSSAPAPHASSTPAATPSSTPKSKVTPKPRVTPGVKPSGTSVVVHLPNGVAITVQGLNGTLSTAPQNTPLDFSVPDVSYNLGYMAYVADNQLVIPPNGYAIVVGPFGTATYPQFTVVKTAGQLDRTKYNPYSSIIIGGGTQKRLVMTDLNRWVNSLHAAGIPDPS